MELRRRKHSRHSVDLPATLTPVWGGAEAAIGVGVRIKDISLGGASVRSRQAFAVGSIWQLRFQGSDRRTVSHTLLVRSCRSADRAGYIIGAECVVDPSALKLAGVGDGAITSEAGTLATAGSESQWELRSHLVAHEPLSLSALCALNVSADKDLIVEESITDCTIDVAGSLVAPRAVLVGGTAHVLRGAIVGELGSADETPTTIVLGESLRSSMMIAAAAAVLASRKVAIEQLQAKIDALSAKGEGSLDHADRERLTVMMSDIQELRHAYSTMDANSRTIRQSEAKRRQVRLEVVRAIHPHVTVIAGDSQMTFTNRLAGPVTLDLLPSGAFDIVSAPGAPVHSISGVANVFRRAA